jgi:hypothetical protein
MPQIMTKELASKRASEIRDLYSTNTEQFSAIISGNRGVGKTRILGTLPKPLLIDSFDPNGTIVLKQIYADEIKSGAIIIRNFWNESSRNPKAAEDWEKEFDSDFDSGFFDYFSSYAIDSMTTWVDAITNRVAKIQGRTKSQLAINDYPIIYNYVKDTIKRIQTKKLNFVLTTHLEFNQDELSGEITADILSFKGLRGAVPILFSEKYIMQTKPDPKTGGVKYILLTQSAGRYQASTQLGANSKLLPEEIPDLKQILKKVNYPYSDKELL